MCFPKESRDKEVGERWSFPSSEAVPVRLSQRKSEPTRLCSEVILGNSILSLLCSNQKDDGCTKPCDRNGASPGISTANTS